MILISKRSLKQTADNNNLETKLNFSKKKCSKLGISKLLQLDFSSLQLGKKYHIILSSRIHARQHDFKLIQKLQ